jgi:hypothetical protein
MACYNETMKIGGGEDITVEYCPGCVGSQGVYAEILAIAKERAPIVPTGFESIMVECCRRSMPLLRPWFEQELRTISTTPDQQPVAWGDLIAIAIVAAASRQCPATPDRPDLEELWANLLAHPRLQKYAQAALGLDQTKSTPTDSTSPHINGSHAPALIPASA